MAFLYFLTCTVLAFTVLVPINYRENGTSEGVPPDPLPRKNLTASFGLDPGQLDLTTIASTIPATVMQKSKWRSHIWRGSTLYLSSHLVYTILFSALALWFLQRNYARYIPLRQLFSLDLAHSIPARTVMVTSLPPHLRNERNLAEYFEGIKLGLGNNGDSTGLGVETVTIVRGVGGMRELLNRRTKALRKLEVAWATWLGNPVPAQGSTRAVPNYVPAYEAERVANPFATPPVQVDVTVATGAGDNGDARLVDVGEAEPIHDANNGDGGESGNGGDPAAAAPPLLQHPTKARPTFRRFWLFGKKIDRLEYLAQQFRDADEAVRKRRRGKFRPTGVGFVTFETLAGAQIAAQTVHYPVPAALECSLAPEPRDVYWDNLTLSTVSKHSRKLVVFVLLFLLLGLWAIPVSWLASLLSWDNIQDSAPRLADFLDDYPPIRAFVQTSLPSLALVSFNGLLPYLLEMLSVLQGLQARSWIEYSLLKKYHLSILFTTLFVFVAASTFQLLQDLSTSPMKVLDKLATTLPGARNLFVAFVMLNGIALMPLQLLQLAVIIPRFFSVMFARTPRDYAELNAPPQINLGRVYPQALLVFTIGLTYSVISPLILPFTTLYFGIAYLVYKYKLLFVFYRPYESRGQAWPIAHNRCVLAITIFQVFMTGLFTVRQAWMLAIIMIPCMMLTVYTAYKMHSLYRPLARFVNLSQACEAQRGAGGEVMKLRRGHPVTRSQSNLNTRRYGANDEGLYVVGQDPHTDYAQPPMSDSFPGVLNTGRRRYGHPALSGSLPEPWLPGIAPSPRPGTSGGAEVAPVVRDALVLTLRRRWSRVKSEVRRQVPRLLSPTPSSRRDDEPHQHGDVCDAGDDAHDDLSRVWGSRTPRKLSGTYRDAGGADTDAMTEDNLLGSILLSDDDADEEEEEVDEQGRALTRCVLHRTSFFWPRTDTFEQVQDLLARSQPQLYEAQYS